MTKAGGGTYALMVSITLWGVLLGGVVYSHIVFFPVYLGGLPESTVLVKGTHALNEGMFWMPVHALVIVSLIISLALNWKARERRKLVLITCGIYALMIIVTSLYFLPELFAFAESQTSNVSSAEWLARGNRWQYLSWVRGAGMFAAMVPLLFALIRPEVRDAAS